ncbi:hypothetical protein ENHYD8BJ_90084 [Enhydrobacter sp. 8BJ]|nr:hypothetical protein ENHYD8BJ_90084 [Enhydrobacter sp. 8BJ]
MLHWVSFQKFSHLLNTNLFNTNLANINLFNPLINASLCFIQSFLRNCLLIDA